MQVTPKQKKLSFLKKEQEHVILIQIRCFHVAGKVKSDKMSNLKTISTVSDGHFFFLLQLCVSSNQILVIRETGMSMSVTVN